MTSEQIMEVRRGIPGYDIATAMNQVTDCVDWTRSPKRDIAEALSEERYRLRLGFTVQDVAILARQSLARREKRKQENAEMAARLQRIDREQTAARDAEFGKAVLRQKSVAELVRFAQKLWDMLDPSSQSRFLRIYEKASRG